MELEQAKKLGVCRICEQAFKQLDTQPSGWKDRFDMLVFPERVVLNYGDEFAHEACLPATDKTDEPQLPQYHRFNRWWKRGNTYGHDGDCHYWSQRFCDCGLLNYLRYHRELQKLYPKYEEERFYHDNRIALLVSTLETPGADKILGEWEHRLQHMAKTQVETECQGIDGEGCGNQMWEYAIESPDGQGLIPVSQLFGDIFSNYVSLCPECDKLKYQQDQSW